MFHLTNMGGVAQKITPELLPDNMAQSAINAILHRGGVAPLKTPVTVATPTKAGVKKSIYRFGIAQPEWAVFKLQWWDRDALLDWITPTTAVVAVALLSTHW